MNQNLNLLINEFASQLILLLPTALLAISYQPSTISYQLSTISYQPSAISFQLRA
jgi:hypothetical protein